jgi:phenylacetic acid degradation operon negative regulatory protein
MTANTATRKFNALLSSFERRRPLRAGSLIVTIYGDAIVPRGGSLWLGSLLDMMAGFGVEAGLVRTAISRLVTDGWFERTRVGKHSYYRLSAQRAAEFAAATTRIYRAGDPHWSGEMDIAIIASPDVTQRAAHRDRMLREGYGQAAANVMLRPRVDGAAAGNRSPVSNGVISLVTRPAGEDEARTLARTCWQLDDLASAYSEFLKAFAPVADEIMQGRHLTDAQAFQLRVLLAHDWRRIVLRDPQLPRAMLPEDWPGTRARQLIAGVYPRVLSGAERWLDRHAVDQNGALPAAGTALDRRFQAL